MKNMRIYKILILLFILTLWQLPPNGQAGAAANPAWIQAGSGSVNLRQGPGTAFDKVGELSPGTILQVLGQEQDWYKVRLNQGGQAYVASWLVAAADAPAAASTASVSSSSAAAAASGDTAGSAAVVKVFINGQPMTFDVDPIIDNGRTLVPMAAIFSAMGAGITWDDGTRTVTARKGDTTVVLTIGSLTPRVNGEVWKLDVPAKIVGNRTLAPLAFVGQALGGKVAWDASAYQAKIFSPPNPGDKVVAVKVDGNAVNLRSTPSTSSSVIATLDPGLQFGISKEQDGWYQVQHMGRDGWLTGWVAGWVVTPVWSSTLNNSSAVSRGATSTSGATTDTPVETNNTSSGDPVAVQYNKAKDGIRLTIQGKSKARVRDDDKGSLIYTFADSYLQQDANIQEKVGSACLSITGSRQGDDVVIKVDIPSFMKYETNSKDSDKTQILFIPNCITGVNRQAFNTSGERIDVTTLMPVAYTQQQAGNTMVVTLSGASQGLARSSYSYSSQSMKSLDFAEEKAGDSCNILINIETKEEAKFSIGQNGDGTETHILLINKSDIPARNTMVVLDPGHGGKDCGTSGAYSKEKDINLDVALKVGALLQQKGIRVAYTRTDDTFVALENESATANILNAALFVSIHCNGVDSPTPHGTETFYYAPLSTPDLYLQKDERIKLATAIQTRLINALGRTDRGVKENNLSVLRNTDMPSALTELGFLTNPEEEALLSQDSFRQKAAQAIAEGIAACMPAGK